MTEAAMPAMPPTPPMLLSPDEASAADAESGRVNSMGEALTPRGLLVRELANVTRTAEQAAENVEVLTARGNALREAIGTLDA